MKLIALIALIFAAGPCLLAAVDGTVINATTGKPQASIAVTLVQPGAQGMQTLGSTKSDAEGRFQLDKDASQGALLQAVYEGATYNLFLQPGAPMTGVHLKIYDSTSKAGIAKVSQHMILVEPSTTALDISETFLIENETTLTFQDPSKGTVQFYLPEAAGGKVSVSVNSPGGMPISRPAEKTGVKDVYKIAYPVKPGESRFDVSYSLPPGDTFSSKVLHGEGMTRLVTPSTVTLEGTGVEPLGQEPTTKAHIYNAGSEYSAKITGTGSLRNQEAAAAPSGEDGGDPPVEEKPARVYSRMLWIMGITFAILSLGGVLLYRKQEA